MRLGTARSLQLIQIGRTANVIVQSRLSQLSKLGLSCGGSLSREIPILDASHIASDNRSLSDYSLLAHLDNVSI